MGSPRIKGIGLRLTLGDVDYWADATAVAMFNETETHGFMDGSLGSGKSRWFIELTAVQSTAPGSLWTYLFDHPFDVASFVYAPHGNAEPYVDHPHFTGALQLPSPPALGGEAGEDVTYVFTARLNILTGPTKVTG